MSLVPSLLQAIVQLDGEALVMHVGDKPYVVSPTGQVDLASRGLSFDAVVGVVNQLLPAESQQALDEFGAAQYDLPAMPEFPGEHFTIVAARGGDDVWAEVRRRKVSDDDRVPMEFFGSAAEAPATPQFVEPPSTPAESAPIVNDDDDDLRVPSDDQLFAKTTDAEASSDWQTVDEDLTLQTIEEERAAEAPLEAPLPPPSPVPVFAPAASASEPPAPPIVAPVAASHEEEAPAAMVPPAPPPLPPPAFAPAVSESLPLLESHPLAESQPLPEHQPLPSPQVVTPAASESEPVLPSWPAIVPSHEEEAPPAIVPPAPPPLPPPAFAPAVSESLPLLESHPLAESQPLPEHQPLPSPQVVTPAVSESEPVPSSWPAIVPAAAAQEETPPPAIVPPAPPPLPLPAFAPAVSESLPVAESLPLPPPLVVTPAMSVPVPPSRPAIVPAAAMHEETPPPAIVPPAPPPLPPPAFAPAVSERRPVAESLPLPSPQVVTLAVSESEPLPTSQPAIVPAVAAQEETPPPAIVPPPAPLLPSPAFAPSVSESQPVPLPPPFFAPAAFESQPLPPPPPFFAPVVSESQAPPPPPPFFARAATESQPTPQPAAHTVSTATQPAVVLPLARSPIRPDAPPPLAEQALAGLDRLLRMAAARGASTLYLSSASRPSVRVDGDIYTLDGAPVLAPNDVESLLLTLMPERSAEALRSGVASEWICDLPDVGRVRCMSFRDHRGPGGVFRIMPSRAVTADQLGLSRDIQALAIEPEGLLLVSGPRSSGKRTLMSALVDLINRTRRDHVITIESEINIVHERNGSFISQREVRGGIEDMVAVARAALREDPDILVLEELRSAALMDIALDAAGSGQLVIGGIPAHNASGAVDRIIDLYPPEHRRQVQLSLAQNLRGVVAQVLLRKTTGGRVAAREVLLNTPAVSSVLAEGRTSQLPLAIEGGRRQGMVPLNDALVGFVQSGVVDVREAYRRAADRAGFLALLKRQGLDTSAIERYA